MSIPLFFQTERLQIRAVETGDAPFIFELMNTPLWIQFIGDRNVKSVKEAEAYIVEKAFPQLEAQGYTNNVVIRKRDHIKLGTCGIYHREGHEIPDIGFAFLPQYHSEGYAFESADALIQIAIKHYNLKELSGYTLENNKASRRLLERLGFNLKGVGQLPTSDEELLHYHRKL